MIDRLNADPFDIEAQAKIEELIAQKNVHESYENAMENNPEMVVGSVCMLYVQMEVNGVPLQAFIDSGAQMSIMSVTCAEKTGIMCGPRPAWPPTLPHPEKSSPGPFETFRGPCPRALSHARHSVTGLSSSAACCCITPPAAANPYNHYHHCIRRLLDKRFQGTAVGVGTQKIIGRVHQVPMRVGNGFLPCSITVLEKEQSMQFIFGLDMLKRHQCCIDLKRNRLVIGSTGDEARSEGEKERRRAATRCPLLPERVRGCSAAGGWRGV